MTVPPHVDPADLGSYLHRTRWFGGKGRPLRVTGFDPVATLPGDGTRVVVHVVEVTYDDGGEPERYQVPIAYHTEPDPSLDHALVGIWEDPGLGRVHAYDALHDRDAMAHWLAAFEACTDGVLETGRLTFRRLPGPDLDVEAPAALFAGEQSNSSVTFGGDAVLKVFRKLTAGVNPDVEIHELLTRAESPHVAALYGWLELSDPDGGEPTYLAMLQEFLRTATDGWDLALSSVRTLFADGAVHVEESGGDFAGEAGRLGEALREVHETLAHEFPPTEPLPAADLADQMTARLTDAVGVVAGLADHERTLRGIIDRVRGLGEIPTQRIHGDLHLGQTLRTTGGWKLVDFEGEPAKPLRERRYPDSRWRDVAGMLRSFDYAPRVMARALDPDQLDEDELDRHAMLAEKWSARNIDYFLAGYAGSEPGETDAFLSSTDRLLLSAYVADKAVYETLYETRNRPAWVGIPMAALDRIGEQ